MSSICIWDGVLGQVCLLCNSLSSSLNHIISPSFAHLAIAFEELLPSERDGLIYDVSLARTQRLPYSSSAKMLRSCCNGLP